MKLAWIDNMPMSLDAGLTLLRRLRAEGSRNSPDEGVTAYYVIEFRVRSARRA